MSNTITENAMDFIKTTVVVGPPISVGLFGISLENWMFIASIVASIFIVLDKIPSIIRKFRGESEKQDSSGSDSGSVDKPPI